jgi:hypothetical protein
MYVFRDTHGALSQVEQQNTEILLGHWLRIRKIPASNLCTVPEVYRYVHKNAPAVCRIAANMKTEKDRFIPNLS